MSGPIPPLVWQRLLAFLAEGHTGRIVLNVKCGEIRSYELTETGDARQSLRALPTLPLDDKPASMKQSAR